MGNLIIDEFTDLPVSRQRIHQLRLRRDNPEKYKQLRAKYDASEKGKAKKHKYYMKYRERALAYQKNYYKLHKKRS